MCRDPPIVKIKDQGMVSGMFITMHRTQRIIAYLGIPYAMPPIDSLRFAVPVINMLPAWEGIRNGSIPQPKCLQNPKNQQPTHIKVINRLLEKLGMDMDNTMGELEPDSFSENCLYLNIYAPDGKKAKSTRSMSKNMSVSDFPLCALCYTWEFLNGGNNFT